jgi:hypothetical protein
MARRVIVDLALHEILLGDLLEEQVLHQSTLSI